ncbi:MAG: diguanylate cyclase [Gemmatimonadota bacterium]|nr:diguanylate cyclase [Gemmatimonadota bacterium]
MIKALVVDDEAPVRELFEQMLETQGYEVEVASNGEEALDLLKSDQFDAVLLDLRLGPISGLTLLEEIGQMYYPPVILVMTGYGSTDVAIEAMKRGAADFIIKPVDEDVLDIRIRKALEERRAQRLAITDGLTGLYNRRYFEERLEEETRRARRYTRPMSIMMLDIDLFKHYNDNNGHLKGDKVLRDIAHILLRFSRETDITARYGGEEFVMILPETDANNSRLLGERIRVSVEETEFEGQYKIPTKNVTVSIGVSCLTSDEDGHDALERADQALYKSKQNGKNQITILE